MSTNWLNELGDIARPTNPAYDDGLRETEPHPETAPPREPLTIHSLQRKLMKANLPGLVLNPNPRVLHHPCDTE